jgi:hypothetical protein
MLRGRADPTSLRGLFLSPLLRPTQIEAPRDLAGARHHSVLLALAVVLRRRAPHRRSSAEITATGVDPGVGSDEPVTSAVTARAVMPNQEARAARRAVRGIGAYELNHHGRSKRVNRGRRPRRGRTDVPSDQDAYLNSGSQSLIGVLSVQCGASTPGEHRRASLLSWT